MSKWEKFYDEVLDETLYKHVHASGLEVYLLPKKEFSRKYAYFGTKYGSFDNCFTLEGEKHCMPKGIAHFLEHKIFEDESRNVFDRFAALGASVNAFTSFNSTVYHFSTVDNFEASMAELIKFVQRVNLTDENVEKEKGIIVQELKSYEDETDYMVYFNLMRCLYNEHPLRYDIGGDELSVTSTTRKQLQTCYDAFYAPANMMVLGSVDMDPDEFLKIVEDNLSEEFLARKSAVKEPMPYEAPEVNRAYHDFEADIAMPMFEFGIKGPTAFDSEKELLDIAISMKIILDVHFGKSSPFYAELYDAGLINASFGMDFTFGEGYSHYTFGGESDNPEAVVARIKEEVAKIKNNGYDFEGFERIKRKMFGRSITSGNSVQYLTSAFLTYYMKNLDLFRYMKAMHVTKAETGYKYLLETFKETQMGLVIARQGGQAQ